MDPVTAFGLFSGAIQVLQAIASTVSGLRQLTGKLREADFTIQSLIQELACIRTALTSLKEWLHIHRSGSDRDGHRFNELDQDLAVAMDGCRVIMEVLSYEVFELVQSAEENGGINFRTRMKIVWNDDTMRGHQEKLRAQLQALQLLLQVCQCHSSTEQIRLLRKATTRQIIGKVADDAATLRSGRLNRAGGTDSDVVSQNSSRRAVSDRVFDFDSTIMDSPVYQRALLQWTAPSVHPESHPSQPQSRQPSISISQGSFMDEGYSSLNAGRQNFIMPQSPVIAQQEESLLILPRTPSAPVHSRSLSQTQVVSPRPNVGAIRRNASDSKALNRAQSSSSTLGRISSFLGRINTSSRRSLKVSPVGSKSTPITPVSSGRGPRIRTNFHTSIDLTKDGASISPLIKAAQAGSRDEAERLIELGFDIEARHENSGRNALLVASHCGRERVVELLIQNGARLAVTDGSGETALHLSASRGHWEVIELLLEREPSLIETANLKGRTALRVAADCGQPDSVQMLLNYRAQVNTRAENQMTALHAAAKCGDGEIVQLLVSHGADVEAKDGRMMTALHYACEEGHLDAIQVLLDNRANINAEGRDRKTPLICAAEAGRAQAVDFLLKRKASSRSVDDSGMTALHWAAYNGHEETVRVLSEKKALLEMLNDMGRTPLHLAVMGSHFAVVEFLQRKGVPLETRCKTGLSALHYACMADNYEITRLLLLTGADIEAIVSSSQERPLHIVAARGSGLLLDLLCEKGASLDARNGVGDRPLCVASRFGRLEVVKKLLGRGSPLSSKFGDGFREDSPLCLATIGGHWHVASLLLARGASVLKKDEAGWQPIRYAVYYGQPELLRLLLSSGKVPDADIAEIINMPNTIGFSPGVPDDRMWQVRELLRKDLKQSVQEPSIPGSLIQHERSQDEIAHHTLQNTQTPFPMWPARVPYAVEVDSSTPVELPGSLVQETPNRDQSLELNPRSNTFESEQHNGQPLPLTTDRVPALLRESRDPSPLGHRNKRSNGGLSRSRPNDGPPVSATFTPAASSYFLSLPPYLSTSPVHRPLTHRAKDQLPRAPAPGQKPVWRLPTDMEQSPRTILGTHSAKAPTDIPADAVTQADRQGHDDDSDGDSIFSVYTAPEGEAGPDASPDFDRHEAFVEPI